MTQRTPLRDVLTSKKHMMPKTPTLICWLIFVALGTHGCTQEVEEKPTQHLVTPCMQNDPLACDPSAQPPGAIARGVELHERALALLEDGALDADTAAEEAAALGRWLEDQSGVEEVTVTATTVASRPHTGDTVAHPLARAALDTKWHRRAQRRSG